MIEYCITKVKLLQINGVTPIMVFDGARLPMKRRIEDERKRQRQESRKAAEELLEAGEFQKANRKFNEAVEINFLMKYRLIQVIKSMGIAFLVAPYEADAQLAFMFQSKMVDIVVTEDSDLLAYGVTKVFFKMDLNGKGFEIDLVHLSQCESFKLPPAKKSVVFTMD